jgi:hypothetical protein
MAFCKEKRIMTDNRKNSAEEEARKARRIPFPDYTKEQYEQWETSLRKRVTEKSPGLDKNIVAPGTNSIVDRLFYSNTYFIEKMLREIVLALHNEIREQLRKSKNKRDFTNYTVLAKLFVEYCIRAGAQYEKGESSGKQWDKFSAPIKFVNYRYDEKTSEKFLLVLLGIEPENKGDNFALNDAVRFFTSTLTTLAPQDDLPHSPYPYISYPFFWRFIEPGDLDNKSKKRTKNRS